MGAGAVCFAWLMLAVPTTSQAQELESAFVAAARRIPALDPSDVLYDRLEGPDAGPGSPILLELRHRQDPPESLVRLLAHPNARVRTVAMMVLFDSEEPRFLPSIAALRRDQADSIPFSERYTGQSAGSPADMPDRYSEPATVGLWAGYMVDMYTRMVEAEDFESYWRVRSGRQTSASWFLLRLIRAQQGASPVDPDRLPGVASLRREIDALPAGERELVLLYVGCADAFSFGETWESVFASEEACLRAAKTLGRKRLLGLLDGSIDSEDPDVRVPQRSQVFFLLDHAQELFTREDVLAIRAAATRDEELRDARWRIAEAELCPERALEIVRAGYQEFDDYGIDEWSRGRLLVAGWQLCAEHELAELLPLVFEEPLEGVVPPARVALLETLANDGSVRARRMATQIVRNRAFEELDGLSLLTLARAVNRWTEPAAFGPELLTLEDLRRTLRLEFARDRDAVEREFPLETQRYHEQLAALRAKCRASLPRWAP